MSGSAVLETDPRVERFGRAAAASRTDAVTRFLATGHTPLRDVDGNAPYTCIGWVGDQPVLLRKNRQGATRLTRYDVWFDGGIEADIQIKRDGKERQLWLWRASGRLCQVVLAYFAREAALSGRRMTVPQLGPQVAEGSGYALKRDDSVRTELRADPDLPPLYAALNAEQRAAVRLLQRFSDSRLAWSLAEEQLNNLDVYTTTGFFRHFALWEHLQPLLMGRSIRDIGVIGLGLTEKGHTSEVYELAARFPQARVTGFDMNRTVIESIRSRRQERIAFDSGALMEYVESEGLWPAFETQSRGFGNINRPWGGEAGIDLPAELRDRVDAEYRDFMLDALGREESYDLITCLNMLPYLHCREDRLFRVRTLIAEAAWALKPGGSLVFNDHWTTSREAPFTFSEYRALGLRPLSLSCRSLEGSGTAPTDYTVLTRTGLPRPVLAAIQSRLARRWLPRGDATAPTADVGSRPSRPKWAQRISLHHIVHRNS